MERLREPGAPGTPEQSVNRNRNEALSLKAIKPERGGPTQVDLRLKRTF